MPIKIPDTLPAREALENENIFVMNSRRATTQDIRPLEILILNLMPTKVETEIQLLRLLSNSPLQVDIDFLRMATHESKNTSHEYLEQFYKTFGQVRLKKYDGMIITGAPVETLPFEKVDYWPELCEIMDWSVENVYSTLHICWGAQAGLYHHYRVPKYRRAEKLSGIYAHRPVVRNHPLLRGFDDLFYMPHSRYTEIRRSDLDRIPDIDVLAVSDIAGVAISATIDGRQIFVQGHMEYDLLTLRNEYERDRERGIDPNVPDNYFPGNSPRQTPIMYWQSHANMLFGNWLNYSVYQQTPYDILEIGRRIG